MSALFVLTATASTQDAVANGDTRSLSFFHTHTREKTTVTFRKNGRYDSEALAQLNWFLRDWRVDEQTKMDPRLFDILWEVYRESGSREPIHIISAYRSPATNGALRRRSSGVAKNSQHMLGKAMDIRLPDVDTARLRAIAMRMQYGGVGYYPSSQFVHVDTGSVRAWPRMTRQQLVKLFPDGKTLHLPADGKPLEGYELAKAEILARNRTLATQASAGGGSIGGLLTNLFGRKSPPDGKAPAESPTVLAYAAPSDAEEKEQVQAVIPLPPQRPLEAAPSESTTLPAPRPEVETAALPPTEVPSRFEAILGYDEKAAIRALFNPRTAVLDLGFSSPGRSSLDTKRFSGAAVEPLPVLQPHGGDPEDPGAVVLRAASVSP